MWLVRVLGSLDSNLRLHSFRELFNRQDHDCCARCCARYDPINLSRVQNGACYVFSSLVLCNISRHISYMCPPTFFFYVLILMPHTRSVHYPNANLFYRPQAG